MEQVEVGEEEVERVLKDEDGLRGGKKENYVKIVKEEREEREEEETGQKKE